METCNETTGRFILLGLSRDPEVHVILCISILILYLTCQSGNMLIMILIYKDLHLHTPMYFFLSNLSFLDICYTSVTLPKLLAMIINGRGISFIACLVQCHFVLSFQSTEYLLLTVMAYDRFVAICRPLHYLLVMNNNICIALSIFSWIIIYVFTVPITILISTLQFCSSCEINHFYCDVMPLLQLSCSDITRIQLVIFTAAILLGIPCFLLTLTSYIFIVRNIIDIRSSKGRSKAFSTCSSHLTIVTLLYLVLFSLYLRPPSKTFLSDGKVISLLNVAVIPMLNPIIYSLRNKDVKQALKKVIE
ncbi:olfactory receptor 1G1-like [Rhinoderma darwinii]|uniref:olfactory receptor 1G1-like n=1 Tax=Rhinoderma darwinii TaxID=43563 RepID=UPI003F680E71